MDELEFGDLAPREHLFECGGKTYTLREASEGAAIKWRESVARAYDTLPGGQSVPTGRLAGTGALLVSLCTFDDANKPVPESVVRSWPARFVSRLAERAIDISALGGEDNEAVLEARIAAMQERLEAVRAKKGEPAKNA